MAAYYPPAAQQTPPYPTHEPSYYLSAQQPQYAYQEPPPQRQWQSSPPQRLWQTPPPPPQQHNNFFKPQPLDQKNWNAEQIWQEANSSQHNNQSQRSENNFLPLTPQQQGGEGERGLGASVLGGGAGAFLGHEMGHGKLTTLGGLAAGAIVANMCEHHHEKKKMEHHLERAYNEGYERGEGWRRLDDEPESYDREGSRSRGEGRSRGLEESYHVDGEEYEEPRHHHHHHHHSEDDNGYGDDYVDRDVDRDEYSERY